MASLLSIGTGNFTSAGTWGVVDSTSELDSNVSSVAIGTSNVDTATFTPGAITVRHLSVKINARASTPTGTFTLTLRNSTDSVDVASVTVNVSDISYGASCSLGFGWFTVKFSADQTLIAGKAYLIRAVCSSSGSQVTLWRNATANNFCRKLVTTTTAAPASGDHLVITNYFTAAATSTAVTVTHNNTATTSFGPTVSGGPPEGCVISGGGTLASATAAATAYYFKLKGFLHITGGGLFQIGTVGTPIPADSTFTFFADCAALCDTGIIVDSTGTFNFQGASKNPYTYMTADKVSTNTVLALADTTGWRNSDEVAIGPGNVSNTEFELKTISTVDSGTQVTLSSGLSANKRGTAPHRTWVGNITRNIIFDGASSSLRGFLSWRGTCNGTCRYGKITTNFQGWSNSNQGKMGIDIQVATGGVVVMEYIAHGLGQNNVPLMFGWGNTGSFTFRYGCAYKPGNCLMFVNGGSTSTLAVTDNLCVGIVDNAPYLNFNTLYSGWDFRRNIFTGSGGSSSGGCAMNLGNSNAMVNVTNMFDGCQFSYTGANGLYFSTNNNNNFFGTIDSFTAYMNGSSAISVFNYIGFMEILLTNYTAWGNGFAGIRYEQNRGGHVRFTVRNGTMCGSSLQAQPNGVYFAGNWGECRFENVDFGVATGIFVGHSTADLNFASSEGVFNATLIGCALASTTKTTGFSGTTKLYDLRYQRYNNTAADHRRDVKVNALDSWAHRLDTAIFYSGSNSEKITPSITSSYGTKAKSGVRMCNVLSGVAKTISIRVRTSSAGDGAAYNGAHPRLILLANPALGIDTDQVIATHSVAAGTWELLTGSAPTVSDNGVLSFYVDLDGSAGWVNVGDGAAS